MRARDTFVVIVVTVFAACEHEPKRELSPAMQRHTQRLIDSFPNRPHGWTMIQQNGPPKEQYTVEEYPFPAGTLLREARIGDSRFGSLTTRDCLDSECQVGRTKDGEFVFELLDAASDSSDCEIVAIEDDDERAGDFHSMSVEPAPCQADMGDEITVAVFYTVEAQAAAGKTKNDILARIKYAENTTNEALLRSNVQTKISVTAPALLAISDAAQPADFQQKVEKNNLRGNADLLVLITSGLKDCGKAFRQGSKNKKGKVVEGHDFAKYAYAVVRVDCIACGSWSFAHEIGHLLGACHDSSDTCDPFRNNYGFVDFANSFYTLSSTKGSCPSCDRINQWSALKGECKAFATGDATHDNAGRLIHTHITVAKFRCK